MFFSETLPYLAIIALPMLVTVLVILPGAILLVVVSCCACTMKIKWMKKGIDLLKCYLITMMKIMHYSGRAMFKMKASLDDRDDLPQTEIFDYVVPNVFLVQVFIVALNVTGYAAFVFINIFFVEESQQCDANNPDLACFINNASNMTERVNCSVVDSTFNDTLQCYEFVFKTSEALSAAGGLLTMGGVAFAVVVGLILFISKGEKGRKSLPRCLCATGVQILLFIVVFVLLILLPFLDIVRDQLVTHTDLVEYAVLFLILIFSVCVPWFKFKRAPKALTNTSIVANTPPQSFPIRITPGPQDDPPDDGDEGKVLITDETQGNYQSIEP